MAQEGQEWSPPSFEGLTLCLPASVAKSLVAEHLAHSGLWPHELDHGAVDLSARELIQALLAASQAVSGAEAQ